MMETWRNTMFRVGSRGLFLKKHLSLNEAIFFVLIAKATIRWMLLGEISCKECVALPQHNCCNGCIVCLQ